VNLILPRSIFLTALARALREQTGVLTTAQRESFAALQDLASDIKNKPLIVKNDLLEQSETLVQANLNQHEKTRAVCISRVSYCWWLCIYLP
jgi:phosphoribosylpyrophosphate synthetase